MHKLCLTCAAVVASGEPCASCGSEVVSATRANLERVLEARVQVAIDAWEATGAVDADHATRLREASSRPSGAREGAPSKLAIAEQGPGVFDRMASRQKEIASRWHAAVSRLEADPELSASATTAATISEGRSRSSGDTREALEVSEGLFGGPHGGSSLGVGALLGLEDLGPPSEPRGASTDADTASPSALLAEYAWWFLGTLLVLAGSAMGVREAWQVLAGPPRQIVVAGALFGYHAMFLGLSALVAKRSARAGAVLASIAVGLLPTVFVALAALVDGSRALGLGLSAGVVALAFVSLRHTAKRFAAPRWVLPAAVLPSLVAELFVGTQASVEMRVAVPFVGVAAVAFAGRRLAREGAGFAPFASALYAALSLAVLALAGSPGVEPARLEAGSLPLALVWLTVLALSAVVAHTTGSEPLGRRAPRLAPAGELLALGGVTLACVVAAQSALVDAPLQPAAFAFAAVPALGACVFALAARRHPAALHPAVLLAVLAAGLLARAAVPGNTSAALAGAAVGAAGVLLVSRSGLVVGRQRLFLEAWGGGLGLLATGFAGLVATEPLGAPVVECAIGGAAVCLAGHAAGGVARGRLHAFGALGALAMVSALVVPMLGDEPARDFALVCAALAAVYGLAAVPHGARLAKVPGDLGARPLDDVSLALVLLGALSVVASGWIAAPTTAPAAVSLAQAWPVVAPRLAVAVLLALRAQRDQSRLVAFAATLVVGDALSAGLGASGDADDAGTALAMAVAAALATAVAAARGPEAAPTSVEGRRLLGIFPLPFGARGTDLLDGVSAAAFMFAARAIAAVVAWLGPRPEALRGVAVLAVEVLVVTTVLAFVSASHRALRARGSVATLGVLGVLVAFAAVTNRVGRPLPPSVVGFRLTLIVFGVWLLARLVVWAGPRIGAALGRPAHGRWYHLVPHAGVLALGLVLGVDAFLVGGPTLTRALWLTPPLLLVGAALAAFLLARSFAATHAATPLHAVGLACALGAAPLVAVQRSLLGRVLAPLVPPGSSWVVAGTEALLEPDWLDPSRFLPLSESVAGVFLRAWTGLLAFAVVAGLLGAAVAVSPAVRRAVVEGALGLKVEKARHVVHTLAVASLAPCALAVFGALAQPALDVPPVAGLLVAGAVLLAVASSRRNVDLAKGLSAGAALTLGLAAFVGTSCSLAYLRGSGVEATARVGFSALDAPAALGAFGPALALAVAVAAAVAHLAALALEARRPAQAWGAAAGRDLLLAASLVLVAWLAGSATPTSLAMLRVPTLLGGGAVALVAAVAGHALARGLAPRHAYVLQVSAVAGYALLRFTLPAMPPFTDAVAALVFGFVLIGFSTLATRLGIPPVAAATRRFAALLPLLVAVLRNDGATTEAALIAAGSGVLYAGLAAADKSRIFAALAAIAGNVALLIAALSVGFDGVEAYLGPLGLLVLVLSQIFGAKLEPATRQAVRIVGSLLLYLPAASKLVLRLGEGADGTYAVLFGVICLLGVVAGMVLRIRAYVLAGTLFVTLDVVANLAHAGLRDHRIGFVLLSASGLGILAAMIGTTLKRDEVRAVVRRLKLAVRGWD